MCSKALNGRQPIIDHMENTHPETNVADHAGENTNYDKTKNTVVSNALDDGHLKRLEGGAYRCIICEVTVIGIEPAQQHLEGEPHKKVVSRQSVVTPTSPSTSSASRFQGATYEEDSADIRMAVATGILSKRGGNIFCNVCSAQIHGHVLAKQHLQENSHIKKCNEVKEESKDHSHVMQQPRERTRLNNSATISPASIQRVQNVYENSSSPRGIVCVINNIFKDIHTSRQGAEVDSRRIKKTFEAMDYRVLILENLSKIQTMEVVNQVQEHQKEFNTDSFICFVLSHGRKGDEFQTHDVKKTMLAFDDFMLQFIEGNCPELKDKPKIFFCNFCRGCQKESSALEADGSKTFEAPKDISVLYASLENFFAWRHPTGGTIFVSTICDILDKHRQIEVSELYRMAQDKMRAICRGITIEERKLGFSKIFYFDENSYRLEAELKRFVAQS